MLIINGLEYYHNPEYIVSEVEKIIYFLWEK